jgi:hypothetical protein
VSRPSIERTLAVIALAVAACGSPAATLPAPPATPAITAAASGAVPPTVEPASQPPASTVAGTLAPPSHAGAVIEDQSLLAVLPADVGGVAVAYESQAFADAVADTAFVQSVEAAAFAVAVDGEDLASAVVARPRGGLYSDAFFRDWRDSYNEGACGQAGGVAGNAETQIGEQTVYIGTCAGGLRTYHAWLADRGLLISAFSLGDRRFGEQLMAGLRP